MQQETSTSEMAKALVDSVFARPDATNVSHLMSFTMYEADPELQAEVTKTLAARIAASQALPSLLDLNAGVIDCVRVNGGKEMVLVQGKNLGLAAVEALPTVRRQLQVGDQVALQPKEGGIMIAERMGPYPGSVVKRVERLLDEGRLLVADPAGAGERQVLTIAAALRGHPDLTGGAEVLCAPEAGLALSLHEAAQDDRSLRLLEEIEPRSLDDLGGQPSVKRQLQRMLALMTTPAETLRQFGLKRSQLVLLAGAPGTGKTYAALCIAARLKANHDVAVVFVKGPEFLNPLVGASEGAIRGFFEKLRHLARKHELVYVIWDEFESLFHARGKRLSSTIVDSTLVPVFLAEVDGAQKAALDNVWLIAISNKPNLLDAAITREGRLGAKVIFGALKSEEAASEIVRIHLRERLLADGLCMATAADRLAAYAWGGTNGQGLPIASIRMRDGRNELITSQHILTGAILKGAIDRAAERAWYRFHHGGVRGIQLSDLISGIEQAVTSLPLAIDNLDDYLGWPLDECARVVEVRPLSARAKRA